MKQPTFDMLLGKSDRWFVLKETQAGGNKIE